jgi:hypothetical protein
MALRTFLQVFSLLDFGIGGFPYTKKGSSTDGKKGPSPDLQKLNISIPLGIN